MTIMLQLGGTLVYSSARRTPGQLTSCWRLSATNMRYASTAQKVAATAASTSSTSQEPEAAAASAPAAPSKAENADPQKTPAAVADKKQNEISSQNPQSLTFKRPNRNKTLISATFKSLSIASESVESEKTKELNEKIRAAKNIDEMLAVTDDPKFSKQNAAAIIPLLYNWVSEKKIQMSDLQENKKFWKAYNTLGVSNKPSLYKGDPLRLFESEPEDKIKNLSAYQAITILSKLAQQQSRYTPMLQAITAKLVQSDEKLNIKLTADILYCMSMLTYYDQDLMGKLSKILLNIIPSNQSSAVIGSILRSLGVLRYRNEPLLNILSKWIVDHEKIVRPQEINNLLMTLAYLGYKPDNMSEVLEKIIQPLKESDMCQSSEWLDIIWSLTILNQAAPAQYESVLNGNYLNRLFDESEYSMPKSLKVLNVNAGARLLPDYKGPLLPDDSHFFNTIVPCSKEKRDLSNSITSALKILVPSNSISININTKMGFAIDAEICVDSKGTPLLINSKKAEQKEVQRIAIITCCYHDFCRGVTEVTGPMKFYCKLLEHKGYKTMMIPYTDINIKDKLIQRVEYINENIKKLVKPSSQ